MNVAYGLIIGMPMTLAGALMLLYRYAVASTIDPRITGLERCRKIALAMFQWPNVLNAWVPALIAVLGVGTIMWFCFNGVRMFLRTRSSRATGSSENTSRD